MSELGVFAVDRGIFDHPLLSTREPFTRREAWLWLLSEAAWKPRKVDRGGQIVCLQRGQLAHSLRFIADAWGWSKSAVDRFFGRLKTETMIGTASGTGVLVITICNYDAYQRVSLPDRDSERDADRDTSGTAAGQTKDIQTFKEEDMSEKAVSDPPAKGSRNRYPDDFEACWRAFPTDRNMSKSKALTAWKRLSVEDRALVLPSIPSFRRYCEANATYRPVHFVRYLSERRFEGHSPATALATAEDWQKRLTYARRTSIWSTVEWGPMPGRDGCRAPAALLVGGDGKTWTEHGAAA